MIIFKQIKTDEEGHIFWKHAKFRKDITVFYKNQENERFFNLLINSHLTDEEEKFRRYFRLSRERLAYLLNLVEEELRISSCNRVKIPITPAEKLALTLR